MNSNNTLGVVTIKGEEFPQWSINHYLQVVTTTYLKLFQLRKIINLFQNNASNHDFSIGVKSIDLFPDDKSKEIINDEIVVLTTKQQSVKEFWHYFKYLSRPLVFYKQELIYDYQSEYSLVVKELSNQSPVEINIQGAVDTLIDLFRGKLIAERENKYVRESLNNIERIVDLSHKIEDSRTPSGVKEFAIDQLEALMNHQNEINRKLGIEVIDLRV